MDYQKFINQLPDLYEDWGQDSVKPKSKRFRQILEQVQGTTTANIMQLINLAVACLEPDEVYCEVGSHEGATLVAALLDHPEKIAYAVDNLAEIASADEDLEKLIENLTHFGLQEQVNFCNQDVEEFLLELREVSPEEKIGVYFYNGPHDYRTQLLGLLLIRPFLANQALVLVSNSHSQTVQQATWDFLAVNPECKLLPFPNFTTDFLAFGNGIQILSWDINADHHYPASTFQQKRQQLVVQAIYNLQKLEQRDNALDALYQEAVLLHDQGNFASAEKKYREFLLWRDQDAEAWLKLAMLYYEFEYYQQAFEAFLNSLKIDNSKAQPHYYLGLIFERFNQSNQAILAYKEAITIEPRLMDAYTNLGNLLTQRGEIEQAKAIYLQAITAEPNYVSSYLNLGNILLEQNEINPAIEAYQTALKLEPENQYIISILEFAVAAKENPVSALLYFGNQFYQQKKYQAAIDRYQKVLQIQSGDPELYFSLSQCFKQLSRTEEAIKVIREGLDRYPTVGKLHFELIQLLQHSLHTQEAAKSAEVASHFLPDDYTFQIIKNLIVPTFYQTTDEIGCYRQRFIQGLQNLIQQTLLDTPAQQASALSGIGTVTNFYLGYQAQNDRELQSQYGELVHKIMAANYPNWVQPLPMPSLKDNHKIRIGYVSAYLHSYSGTLWLVGWLRNCDKQNFEIYCYYTGNEPDLVTQLFRDSSEVFHHIPDNSEAVCQQITADQMHILVFPEIGMNAPTLQIAGLRLAPVQCLAWGHPITSGLPTIDYFLSSELMEPDNAQEHYSETLIRLPNIGVAYPKPADIPPITKNRSDFSLRDDAIVYLCCQAPFKYLPQYDFILPEIARQVPQAQFVFLRGVVLQPRLHHAFAAVGLKSEDYCVFITVPTRPEYLMLNLLSDIFLDTLTWSGGNTALEAIACNLPIVTCPGEFMRGRHAYSFLRMLGVTDTIAQTETEYIEIAVRLGLDPEWRQDIAERMKTRHDHLYDDKVCVAALEDFYKQVVQKGLTQ